MATIARTVRSMVAEAQAEIRDTPELSPERARVLLAQLAALLGNCNDEIRKADAAYSDRLLRCLEDEKAANRARLRAETSDEFARRCAARDTKELVVELIRSLKYLLRSLEEEMRLAGRT